MLSPETELKKGTLLKPSDLTQNPWTLLKTQGLYSKPKKFTQTPDTLLKPRDFTRYIMSFYSHLCEGEVQHLQWSNCTIFLPPPPSQLNPLPFRQLE